MSESDESICMELSNLLLIEDFLNPGAHRLLIQLLIIKSLAVLMGLFETVQALTVHLGGWILRDHFLGSLMWRLISLRANKMLAVLVRLVIVILTVYLNILRKFSDCRPISVVTESYEGLAACKLSTVATLRGAVLQLLVHLLDDLICLRTFLDFYCKCKSLKFLFTILATSLMRLGWQIFRTWAKHRLLRIKLWHARWIKKLGVSARCALVIVHDVILTVSLTLLRGYEFRCGASGSSFRHGWVGFLWSLEGSSNIHRPSEILSTHRGDRA